MGQLGQTTRKEDKSRYIGNRTWSQLVVFQQNMLVNSNNMEYLTGKMMSRPENF